MLEWILWKFVSFIAKSSFDLNLNILDRDSSFLVTGYDSENNIVEVDYIG